MERLAYREMSTSSRVTKMHVTNKKNINSVKRKIGFRSSLERQGLRRIACSLTQTAVCRKARKHKKNNKKQHYISSFMRFQIFEKLFQEKMLHFHLRYRKVAVIAVLLLMLTL